MKTRPAAVHYFSANYFEARERLLDASSTCDARLVSHRLNAPSPSIQPLSLDVVVLGATAPQRAVIVSSGVHGVEGPLGSAMQTALLEQWNDRPEIADDVAVVLLHAVNPYGYAWHRRFNEHNVDLNRNFLLPGQSYAGAPQLAKPFRNVLGPLSKPTPYGTSTLRMGYLALRHGRRAFWETLPVGQYEHPDWLFYGGNQLSPSGQILKQVLPPLLSSATDVIHIDVHTGLGRWAECELLLSEGEPSDQVLWWRQNFATHRVVEANRFSRYTVRGGFGPWLQALLPHCSYRYATAEFGTYPAARVVRTLAEESRWTRMVPDLSPRHWSRLRLAEAFAPRSPKWRGATHQVGMQLIDNALRVAQPSR